MSFTANLKYDLASQEKAEEALKVAEAEKPSNPNFEVKFSTNDQFLLVDISSTSSTLLQEGLNSVYPIIDKVFQS